MPCRFAATYEYTEIVKGEPRSFVHETIFEAVDLKAANRLALEHFEDLAMQTGVGWRRVLNRIEVMAASSDAVASGGRRSVDRKVEREFEV